MKMSSLGLSENQSRLLVSDAAVKIASLCIKDMTDSRKLELLRDLLNYFHVDTEPVAMEILKKNPNLRLKNNENIS